MELSQLQSFAQAAQLGSFTKAAEALYITQPALSAQIKSLERELGVPLFERRNRRVYLTEIGAQLLQRVQAILTLVEQMQIDVAEHLGLEAGQIRIGTSDTICLYLLPDVIEQFTARYPGIEIALTNKPSTETVALLRAGLVDFGIVTLPQPTELTITELTQLEDVLICHPQHDLLRQPSLTLADIAAHRLLLLEESSTSRALLDQQFAAAGVQPEVMDLGSVEVIKRYVAIGLGIGIVPRAAVAVECAQGALHALALPWLPQRTIGIVRRRHSALSPGDRAFIALLQAHFALK